MNDRTDSTYNQWMHLFLFLGGASLCLFLTTVFDMGVYQTLHDSTSGFTLITAWFGVWFILVITTAAQGLYILFVRSTRMVPFKQRIRLGFAFLSASWLNVFSADLRMISVEPPALFHWLIIFSGISLLGLYLIFSRINLTEEIFP